MLKVVLTLVTLLMSASVIAGESYLCVSDLSVGFAYHKATNSWGKASFPSDEKFIISKSEAKEYEWVVKQIGDQSPTARCKYDFNEAGALFCDGITQIFRMNRINGRFMSIYPVGYWTVNKNAKEGALYSEGSDTPYMEVGKCSPI